MKENEYDNGHTERQTVGSNPSKLPPIRVSVFDNYYATQPLGDVDLIKWCKTAKFKGAGHRVPHDLQREGPPTD